MSAPATHTPASRRARRAAAEQNTRTAIEGAKQHVDFLNLDHWLTYSIATNERGGYEVFAELSTRLEACPGCGTTAPEFKRNGRKRQSVRDVPHDGKPVLIRFMRQRYLCLSCGKSSQQPLAGVSPRRKITQRLIEQTEREAFHVSSTFKAVAARLGLSDRTVRNVFTERGIQLEKTVRFETPRRIGVDGVYINRKQRCIVTDLTTGRILEILPECRYGTLAKYLTLLADHEKVELVAMDMCPYLASAVRKALPEAAIVIDTFHVQRMANEELNMILRKSRVRVPLTGERRPISLMRPGRVARTRFLLDRRRGRLTEREADELLRWRREVPVLDAAYKLKEGFLNVWLADNRRQAEERYDGWACRVDETLPRAFTALREIIKNWREEVFNFFDYGRETNACTESRNNSIKTLQHIGRGYKFPVVRTKLLYSDIVTGCVRARQTKKASARRAARPANPNSNVERLRGAYEERVQGLSGTTQVSTDWLRRFDHLCDLRLVRSDSDTAKPVRRRRSKQDSQPALFPKCRVG